MRWGGGVGALARSRFMPAVVYEVVMQPIPPQAVYLARRTFGALLYSKAMAQTHRRTG